MPGQVIELELGRWEWVSRVRPLFCSQELNQFCSICWPDCCCCDYPPTVSRRQGKTDPVSIPPTGVQWCCLSLDLGLQDGNQVNADERVKEIFTSCDRTIGRCTSSNRRSRSGTTDDISSIVKRFLSFVDEFFAGKCRHWDKKKARFTLVVKNEAGKNEVCLFVQGQVYLVYPSVLALRPKP